MTGDASSARARRAHPGTQACIGEPMHTRTNSRIELRRKAVRLLAEQGAIPLDQMASFLGLGRPATRSILGWAIQDELVEWRQFLIGDFPWAWLTPEGAEEAGLGFKSREPAKVSLKHRRAVNGVRLYLASRRPDGIWVCERELQRTRCAGALIPDGLFEVDGECHAIEVELSRKHVAERRWRLTEYSRRYDLIAYFCGPNAHASMQRMVSEGRWPKLVVRKLPKESV